MGYIQKHLLSGENTFHIKINWIVFAWPIVFTLLATYIPADAETVLFKVLFFLIATISWFSTIINYKASECKTSESRNVQE